MIAFTVPGNPVPWQRAGAKLIRGRPMFFTRPETRAHQRTIGICAKVAGVERLTGAVELHVRFFRKSAQRCDLDNLEKTVKDALNGIAWLDDSQVVHLVATKAIDRTKPRTEIEIIGIPPSQGELLGAGT